MYSDLRKELLDYYIETDDDKRSMLFAKKCFDILDKKFRDGMSVTEQKLLQYEVISDEFEPKLFRHLPYFYETGVLFSLSDGSRMAKRERFCQANGWVYKRNEHLFVEQDEALYAKRTAQLDENLYLICGPYNDTAQHFNLNLRPFLKIGAKGIYEKAKAELKNAVSDDEREFLNSVCV